MSADLHVIYRSTAGENPKARPSFYGKLLALKSFLLAVERCAGRVECVFMNDGPIPADRLDLMHASGEVVEVSAGSSVHSYLESLRQVELRNWPEADLVYLVEDDYLHMPDSLDQLLTAAAAAPSASYFTLYDLSSSDDFQAFQVGDAVWRTVRLSTATFAARLGVLRSDRRIHGVAYAAGGAWDRDLCLAYQGVRPHRWPALIGDLLGSEPGPAAPPVRRLKRATAQAALNLLALRRSFARRLLIAPCTPLATHMEEAFMARGVHWEAVAERVEEEWEASRDRLLQSRAAPAGDALGRRAEAPK
ncbi:MAG TPA: hypothetical protein VGF21_18230 [Thermoleophilaceae bacterium]